MEKKTSYEISKKIMDGGFPSHDFPKDCNKEWISVESLKEWIEYKCQIEESQELYIPHLLEAINSLK